MSCTQPYIDRYICVKLKNKSKVCGECFTVDPISKTIILFTVDHTQDGKFYPQIILSHAIDDVTIEMLPVSFQSNAYTEFKQRFIRNLSGSAGGINQLDQEQMNERQNRMQEWLELNRIPVSLIDGNVLSVVNGLALIEPPYTIEACRSTNTVVLDRVMRIVKSCPTLKN